ncbi:hypothetical protein AGMMS49928_09310 [Spirochaetia bacterium]|nr:hypothetical protein AGMMS49928_09310 [Spirochaetia bacterium]
MSSLKYTLGNIITSRDELSPRNFRRGLWAAILVFPLSVIIGDLRYFDQHFRLLGLESWELMLFPLGLGWLVLALLPKRLIIPALRLGAVLCGVILPFQLLLPEGLARFSLFMAFQFLNGVCAGSAFYLFCFALNNVERLFGMILLQCYYGFYYTFWRAFPGVQAAGKTWGAVVVMVLYLVTVLLCRKKEGLLPGREGLSDMAGDGKGSGVSLVIGLDVVYYLVMCMTNYVEYAEKRVNSWAFGAGEFAAIALVLILHILINRSALYSWLLFIVLSLLGLGALLYDAPPTILSGSFAYGLGEGLGYIIIFYICGGAIKRSRSLKMFRLYCLMFFIEYFVISGILTKCNDLFSGQSHILTFGMVFILCCVCFLLTPLLQKKVFDAPWTDGLYLTDMVEYAPVLAEAEKVDTEKHLGLSPRETEVFTLLLTEAPAKQIAHTLKISYSGVNFHTKNLYRKLGIQSRTELFAKFGKK